MPVYEYRCNDCGREFEYQQRMSEPDKTGCEACGKETLERLISRTAFALKGSGWYKDLYSSSKPETSGDAKSGDAKTADAKPAGDKAATPKTDGGSTTPTSTTPAASTPASTSTSSGSTSSGGSSSGGGAASSS